MPESTLGENTLWSKCLNTERIPDSFPYAESAAKENLGDAGFITRKKC